MRATSAPRKRDAIEAELDKIRSPGTRPAINLAGKTSLARLAGVLATCAAFVSNDSGAMHLAAAVGTPVVALFGATDERVTAPLAARARWLLDTAAGLAAYPPKP